MSEFIRYIERRRAQLRKELYELDVAEKVYREATDARSLEERGDEQKSLFSFRNKLLAPDVKGKEFEKLVASVRREFHNFSKRKPNTIKQMVSDLLNEVYPAGLTSLEILDYINRRWRPELERTSLSPQLSRLKRDNVIRYAQGRWFLVVNETGAPADTVAPVSGADRGSTMG